MLTHGSTFMVNSKQLGSSTPPEMDDLAAKLSRNIATRRRALGLTQAQVAERLGVDTETLSRFERGKHLPSLVTLERLSSLLHTTTSDLLSEEQPRPTDEAEAISSWLAPLSPRDKEFACSLLKQCCDYLASRS